MTRCPLCFGWSHVALRDNHLRCKLCSLAFPRAGGNLPDLDSYRARGQVFCFPSWNNWLSKATGSRAGAVADAFGFAPGTVQMFATRQGRRVTSLTSNLPFTRIFAQWRFGRLIRAKIEDGPQTLSAGGLTLGIIAASNTKPDLLALCSDMMDCTTEAIIVLDTPDPSIAAELEAELRDLLKGKSTMRTRVIAHPLNNDFASQRNRIQSAALTEWVIQLDTDETLTASTKRLLPRIIDDAEHGCWDAVGLSRRNLVDGVMSAMYPDIQYRLLRRSIRFTRDVHEYPELQWYRRQFVYLGAEIVHTIPSSRLDIRERRYHAIEAGADRPHDTALLRQVLEINLPFSE